MIATVDTQALKKALHASSASTQNSDSEMDPELRAALGDSGAITDGVCDELEETLAALDADVPRLGASSAPLVKNTVINAHRFAALRRMVELEHGGEREQLLATLREANANEPAMLEFLAQLGSVISPARTERDGDRELMERIYG